MKITTIISTVAVLGVIVAGVGFASANGYMGHGGFMNHNGNGSAMTQLSSEKQTQLSEMHEMNYNKMRPIQSELNAKYLELNALSNNSNVRPEIISQLTQDITTLRGQIQDNNIAFSKDVESKIGIEYSNYGHRGGKGSGHGNGNGHRGGDMNGGGHRGGMMGNHNS